MACAIRKPDCDQPVVGRLPFSPQSETTAQTRGELLPNSALESPILRSLLANPLFSWAWIPAVRRLPEPDGLAPALWFRRPPSRRQTQLIAAIGEVTHRHASLRSASPLRRSRPSEEPLSDRRGISISATPGPSPQPELYRAAQRRGPRPNHPLLRLRSRKAPMIRLAQLLEGAPPAQTLTRDACLRQPRCLPRRLSIYPALGAKMISGRVRVRWPSTVCHVVCCSPLSAVIAQMQDEPQPPVSRKPRILGGANTVRVLEHVENVRLLKRRVRTKRRKSQQNQTLCNTDRVPVRPPITTETILEGCA